MSNRVISIDELAVAVEELVDEKIRVAEGEFKKDITAAANTSVKSLKANSPKRTGEYAQSWRKSIDGTDAVGYEAVVYQANKPSLTHLLEKGHGKVLWGHRTGGFVPPIPHIEPAYNAGAAELLRRLGR